MLLIWQEISRSLNYFQHHLSRLCHFRFKLADKKREKGKERQEERDAIRESRSQGDQSLS